MTASDPKPSFEATPLKVRFAAKAVVETHLTQLALSAKTGSSITLRDWQVDVA